MEKAIVDVSLTLAFPKKKEKNLFKILLRTVNVMGSQKF